MNPLLIGPFSVLLSSVTMMADEFSREELEWLLHRYKTVVKKGCALYAFDQQLIGNLTKVTFPDFLDATLKVQAETLTRVHAADSTEPKHSTPTSVLVATRNLLKDMKPDIFDRLTCDDVGRLTESMGYKLDRQKLDAVVANDQWDKFTSLSGLMREVQQEEVPEIEVVRDIPGSVCSYNQVQGLKERYGHRKLNHSQRQPAPMDEEGKRCQSAFLDWWGANDHDSIAHATPYNPNVSLQDIADRIEESKNIIYNVHSRIVDKKRKKEDIAKSVAVTTVDGSALRAQIPRYHDPDNLWAKTTEGGVSQEEKRELLDAVSKLEVAMEMANSMRSEVSHPSAAIAVGVCLTYIGVAYGVMEQLLESESFHKQAIQEARAHEHWEGLKQCFLNLEIIYERLGRPHKAEECRDEAIYYSRYIRDQGKEFDNQVKRADYHRRIGEARECMQKHVESMRMKSMKTLQSDSVKSVVPTIERFTSPASGRPNIFAHVLPSSGKASSRISGLENPSEPILRTYAVQPQSDQH